MTLTAEEETQVGVLLNNSNTPQGIKKLLSLLLNCRNSLKDSHNRVEYLERLAKVIVQTPLDKLETVSYIPTACPQVPQLITIEEPSEHPIPAELQQLIYKGALDLGLQLLTPMEAGAMLKGIGMGTCRDQESILPLILMISVGQKVREQQQ